jgi:hypothetical protein
MPAQTERTGAPASPNARPWLEAEIDLADARINAVAVARAAVENVTPWLPGLERQQMQAAAATLELIGRRLMTLRDGHEANLRRAAGE